MMLNFKVIKDSCLSIVIAFLVGLCAALNGYISVLNFTFFIILTVLIRYVFIPLDCDFLLFLHEKFGKSVAVLDGKIIWITGASTGIGEALALNLSKAKVKLILSARSEDKLLEVKAKCIENGIVSSDDVLVVPFDMTMLSKHEWALSAVIKHFGKLDILISNAGRSQRARWEKIEVSVDQALFELNVFSLITLSRLVTSHFISVGGGHHVVMSSIAGKIGIPMSASYTASKHALHGYFECLRGEQGKKGITITMLCPGPVESNLMAGCLRERLDETRPEAREGKMMSADRCAQLSVVAIANRLSEAWIAANPVLLLFYVSQYNPTLAKWIVNNVDFKAIATKMRDGRADISSQNN